MGRLLELIPYAERKDSAVFNGDVAENPLLKKED
jgi:hypothetical protein